MLRLIGDKAYCLQVTKNGHPHHPLRLPAAMTPTPYPRNALAIQPAP